MKRILSLILPALACAVLLLALPAHAEDGVIIDAQTFPDPVFRQWLLDGANLNGMGADGVFTPEELAQITQISVPSLGISSLEGIELFPELTTLACGNNLLTQLDVSKNAKLVTLLCDINRLTELDLSHNTALVNDGSGFVARNNHIRKIVLPDHENLTVTMDVYAEQNPMDGYAETEWYLDPEFTQPIQGDVQAKGQTLYAKWIPNPYTIYFNAAGGTGDTAPISTAYDETVILPSQVTREGYTLLGWTGYVGGKDRVYAPGEAVTNLTGKKDYQDTITLRALWARPTETRLTLTQDSYPYTGQPAALSVDLQITCGGDTLDESQARYVYYSASQPDVPLPQPPTGVGDYLVQAVFPGSTALEQLESRSETLSFSIVQGTAALGFDGSQTLLWTGEPAAIDPAVLTLNGQPWQADVVYSFRAAGSSDEWTPGLPAAAGDYELRAELAGTADHTAASAETTLRVACFLRTEDGVEGAVPVELPAGSNSCRVLVALYDRASGQMLDLVMPVHSAGAGTVSLRSLHLDPRDREDLLVKVFVTGEDLTGLSPAAQYEV